MRKSAHRYVVEEYLRIYPESTNNNVMDALEPIFKYGRKMISDIISNIRKQEIGK